MRAIFHLFKTKGFALTLILSLSTLAANADTVKVGGTGSSIGSVKLLAQAFMQRHPDTKIIVIESLGSSGSIQAVAAGTLNVSFSARPLNTKEQSQNLIEQEIARTPLVLASMRDHAGFTTNDIPKIFDGSLSTWPDNSTLRPILRPDADAEVAILRAISPEFDRALSAARKRPGVHVAITDQDSANAIETIPGAVGTSTLSLILSEQRKIKALPLNGVMPSVSNLAQGRYPYYKPLHMITAQNHTQATQAFRRFIFSQQGAKILSDNGYLFVR